MSVRLTDGRRSICPGAGQTDLGRRREGVCATVAQNGRLIHDRGEMLSLTDMWTAARRKHVEDGGDAAEFENRKPYEWLRSAEAKRFIAALAKTLNTGISRITETARGAGGGTFAHWQVGLAYAQYLSPDFHMWCNTVVRAHMEGLASGATLPPDLRGLESNRDIPRMTNPVAVGAPP